MVKNMEEIGSDKLEDEIYHGDEGEAEDWDVYLLGYRRNLPPDVVDRLQELYRLRQINHNLRSQLEALAKYRTEIMAAHRDEMAFKDRMYEELVTIKKALDERYMRYINQKCVKQEEANPKKRKIEALGQVTKDVNQGASTSTSSSKTCYQNDVNLLTLIPPFLRYLPFGAKVDYICSYLSQMRLNLEAQDVESFMERYPTLFKQMSYGNSEALTKNWVSILHLPSR